MLCWYHFRNNLDRSLSKDLFRGAAIKWAINFQRNSCVQNVVAFIQVLDRDAIDTSTRLVEAIRSFLVVGISRCVAECKHRTLLSSYSFDGTPVRCQCTKVRAVW